MDSEFFSIIARYNQDMRVAHLDDYVYSENMIKEKIGSKHSIKTNIYDVIEKAFPSIKMYFLDHYYKVFYNGKQKLVLQTSLCNLCNKSFAYDGAITYDMSNNIIHHNCEEKRINKIKRNKILEKLENNPLCKMCGEKCEDKKYIMMVGDDFIHRNCCVNKIQETTDNMTCEICNEKMFNIHMPKYEYCMNKNINVAHVECAKKSKEKFRKKHINTRFNKCGVCFLYISNENEFIHDCCT